MQPTRTSIEHKRMIGMMDLASYTIEIAARDMDEEIAVSPDSSSVQAAKDRLDIAWKDYERRATQRAFGDLG